MAEKQILYESGPIEFSEGTGCTTEYLKHSEAIGNRKDAFLDELSAVEVVLLIIY